ncbi:kelch repeat-containing protein [Chryseobacterium shigense]|uniref:Por secretion system C-terminal sorting domain-containing protein n=1 Tax=Chryseobacterium shigense TaxID=297244 RepID=A0A841N4D4_9FLAO|nr:kelch repeat-containing protein [Chryseobacterium shigense]MBB6369601.1 hypothetical protein [Chryseobacterium shigense]
MKKIFFLLISTMCLSQNINFTWIQGGNQIEQNAEFGIYGLESNENWPNILKEMSYVVDNDGTFWMFGGYSTGWVSNATSLLWSYNYQNNNFTFRKGWLYHDFNGYNKGINADSYRNVPGAVRMSSMWASTNKNLYVFGGADASGKQKNDLWKFNSLTNNWIKISNGTPTGEANFGTKGVENITNAPPALINTTTWTDSSGNLYFFGGKTSNGDEYNTVWKYNISTNMWSWTGGADQPNTNGVYNSIGQENTLNTPSARFGSCSFKDLQGNIFIYGGYHSSVPQSYNYNDIWKFNPVNGLWTWMKGSQTSTENIAGGIGVENANNMPGTINYNYNNPKPNNWTDKNGNFWIQINYYMWKYTPSTNSWTLMKKNGNPPVSQPPVYGAMNVEDVQNFPGFRNSSACWTGNDGNLYLYNGNTNDSSTYAVDLWKYNTVTNNWVQVKGPGITSGGNSYDFTSYEKLAGLVESENTPGGTAKYGAQWKDTDGNLWIYGICGKYGNEINSTGYSSVDLWKFNSSQKKWQWINGNENSFFKSYTGDLLNYGTINVENKRNAPGRRIDAMSWIDTNGNLWMFGGQVPQVNSYYQDLWMFNVTSNNWVWKGGIKNPDNGYNRHANYGSQGIYSSANIPGARVRGKTWTDVQGNFYLYGGYGFDETSANEGYLNDVWKYDIAQNQWVWLNGDKTVNNFSSTNYPVADYGTGISWADENKDFWYFTNAKMWKYQTGTNSWSVIGTPPPYGNANYGTMGTESSSNFPGDRNKALTWTGKNGNLWLFGGNSTSQQNLWKYNIYTGNWTWMYGPQSSSSYNYGQLDVSSNVNLPPYRRYSATWTDTLGNLYFFGGTQTETYDHLNYNDVWRIDVASYSLNTNESIKSNGKFKVYPAFFSNEVTVESGENFEKITVSDFSGKTVKTVNFSSDKKKVINLSDLNTGAYILAVHGLKNNILFSTKIIKK